jgi:arylesterase / paraoxonase
MDADGERPEMKRRAVRLVLATLLVALAAGLVDTLVDAGAFRTVSSRGFERCTRVEVSGSEDLVVDPTSGMVLISSTDFRALDRGELKGGAVLAWHPQRPAPPTVVPHDFSGALHPHGLGLWARGDGPRRLFVVNHPTRATSTVEVFDLLDGPALRHVRTVESDAFVSMNDVAPVGPDAFYVTLDAGTRAGTTGRLIETFLRRPWAGVGFVDGTSARVVVEGLRYANGIAVSADGATVFVSETTGRRLLAYQRGNSAAAPLEPRAVFETDTGLDNLTLAADGALWMAAHPKLLDFLGHAGDPAKRSASQVLRATYDAAAARFELTEVAVDDGVALSGSSVAVPLDDGRLLVGSVFEHALDCRVSR